MEGTISLQEILKNLKKRIFLIFSLVIIAGSIGALLSFYIIPPLYQAQTQILVNQKLNNQEEYSWSHLETDLQLINTYNVIIKSPAILNKVVEKIELDLPAEELAEKISVSNESDSNVVNIKVQNQELEQAVMIANTIAEVAKKEIPTLMNVDNITILSQAQSGKNSLPVKPNKQLYILMAIVIGLLMGIGLVLFLEILDSTVKTEKDIEELLEFPIIGVVNTIPLNKEKESALKFRKIRRGHHG